METRFKDHLIEGFKHFWNLTFVTSIWKKSSDAGGVKGSGRYIQLNISWGENNLKDSMYYIFCQEEKKNLEIGDMGSKVEREKERRKFKKRDRVYSWVLCLIQKEKMKI